MKKIFVIRFVIAFAAMLVCHFAAYNKAAEFLFYFLVIDIVTVVGMQIAVHLIDNAELLTYKQKIDYKYLFRRVK